jgi:hypothetical protein
VDSSKARWIIVAEWFGESGQDRELTTFAQWNPDVAKKVQDLLAENPDRITINPYNEGLH